MNFYWMSIKTLNLIKEEYIYILRKCDSFLFVLNDKYHKKLVQIENLGFEYETQRIISLTILIFVS
jgi:hypothetical protein